MSRFIYANSPALGWLGAQFTVPDIQAVTAKLNWIDVPNPAFRMDRKAVPDLDRQIQNVFGLSGAPGFMSALGFQPTARIGKITFQNRAPTRSKGVEVEFKDAALFSSDAARQDGLIHSSLALRPLLPNGAATVYFVAPPWLYFENAPVTSIHDDRKVEVLSINTSPEAETLIELAKKYAIVIFVVLGAGSVSILILVASLVLNLVVPNPMKWQAKMVDAKQIKKQIEFIEYVKAHHPEKMPA